MQCSLSYFIQGHNSVGMNSVQTRFCNNAWIVSVYSILRYAVSRLWCHRLLKQGQNSRQNIQCKKGFLPNLCFIDSLLNGRPIIISCSWATEKRANFQELWLDWNYKINSCIQILWCLMPPLKSLKTHTSEIHWVSKATIVQKIPQVKMMRSTLDRKCNKCWGNIFKNLKRTENNHLHVSRQVHDIKTCLVLQIF